MLGERKLVSAASRLAVILAPLLVASLFWVSYRNHPWSADPAKAVRAVRSSTPSLTSQETVHIDSSGSEGLNNAPINRGLYSSLGERREASEEGPGAENGCGSSC
jgi:hypothetical protein